MTVRVVTCRYMSLQPSFPRASQLDGSIVTLRYVTLRYVTLRYVPYCYSQLDGSRFVLRKVESEKEGVTFAMA